VIVSADYERAVAIVGVGAILPEALSAPAFWQNIKNRRYSITEVLPGRWGAGDYYDPDPAAPDKTYSKIGGWVRGFSFDWKGFRVPPKVAAAMDEGQQWAVTVAAQALADYGCPNRPLDSERTGVILGTAMGGEQHYITTARISFPEFADALASVTEFDELPQAIRDAILAKWHAEIGRRLPEITEDTMPGELPNIVSGRVANVLNLRGPSFVADAACASSFAAINAAAEMLIQGHADAIISGGVDRNMGASTFVKFCKIGALSATGSRPFAEGADGFVMGEGSAAFLLKRLADAERDGDRIYAVLRGVGASSDGKGKGITAPNPAGQVLAIRRGWENAGLDPATCTLIEAHGTSTKVGDVVEVGSLAEIFCGAPHDSIALGSVKSNIGHLKAGAGAAGLLKAVYALHEKVLPPTLNATRPNPNIDFAATPFFLNHDVQPWERTNGTPRRCAVSAYGFGGTNFHLVLEEHAPGALRGNGRVFAAAKPDSERTETLPTEPRAAQAFPAPLRGVLALGADTVAGLSAQLDAARARIDSGWLPPVEPISPAVLSAAERLFIDYGTQAELTDRVTRSVKAFAAEDGGAATWRALQARGVFRGGGPARGKLAFLFPGQGSQYVNMGRDIAAGSPTAARTFAEADAGLVHIFDRPLTSYIFFEDHDAEGLKQAEARLMQTAITQPAVLAMDTALCRLLLDYGLAPDMVMGHSLGEYAALVAAGVMPFEDALEAASSRGAEMTRVSVTDNGWMAAVMAPLEVVQETLAEVDGYVVPANINSTRQCVVGGASAAVEKAIAAFHKKGYQAVRIPVSHAFHTAIVAPAAHSLRKALDRLRVSPPRIPLVANVTGDIYPDDPTAIRDLLEKQIESPVQWVKGLQTLYDHGCRTFIEVGPKRVLKGFVDDVFAANPEVACLFTNHPKTGELPSLNQALCAVWAAGYGARSAEPREITLPQPDSGASMILSARNGSDMDKAALTQTPDAAPNGTLESLTRLLAQALEQAARGAAPVSAPAQEERAALRPYDRNDVPQGSVVISGTGLGLPGVEKPVMDPDNALRILRGEQLIDLIPERFRHKMLQKRITRLVKSEDGTGSFQVISDPDEVIRLAGRPGSFDLAAEYGVPEKLVEALDTTTQLAIAAGLDALHEAGIPLVQTWKRTSTGKYLPDRWLLPESMRDETGVIFASAFPGGARLAEELSRYFEWEGHRQQVAALEDLRRYTSDPDTLAEISRRTAELREQLERAPYEFDRRFIFRIIAMGHSQFGEYIGARGPNTHVNAACASTTQAIAVAEDWIRTGRCRRVIVVAADNVTGDALLEWVGAGFLSLGAAATDDRVEEAALPFDRRRHGTLLGMGACSVVIEAEDALAERGMRGIVEVLSSETANSAYHGSRLDVDHISQVMNHVVTAAERRFGLNRHVIAPHTVFMSHETFTPARGGSASAEVVALRKTFGPAARDVIVANTKGFTGHPMGVGVEDVIAVKILEYGIVPPVPNFREVDPELGVLNLSRGGRYPVSYGLHLAAGFGSQISMVMIRRIPGALDRVDDQLRYQHWLDGISGYRGARLETVKRVLRVQSQDGPGESPMPSGWRYGTGPIVRASAPGDGVPSPHRPAPMPQVAELLSAPRPSAVPNASFAGTASAPTLYTLPAPVPAVAARVEPSAPVVRQVVEPAVVQVSTPLPAAAGLASVRDTSEVPPTPPDPAVDPVLTRVLSIVAEKTGYPQDMLDPELDLEADLGIDTVKQAETFAAIRQAYDIPFHEGLSLRAYPTLASVVGFVHTMRPDLAARPASERDTSEAPPTSPHPAIDPVLTRVLSIVAEKTGYPQDMLDPELDLEADLGIDTVKQAETFAAIRQAYDIPFQEGLSLRAYPTLASVVGFVHTMRPDLAATHLSTTAGERPPASAQDARLAFQEEGEAHPERSRREAPAQSKDAAPHAQTIGTLEDADRIPRRVPVPTLRPSLDLCQPTGVTLGPGSRVVVMPDGGETGHELARRLVEIGATPLMLGPDMDAAGLQDRLQGWLAEGPVHGVYWLPALDVEPPLAEIDLGQWRELLRRRVKTLYATMRVLYDAIAGPGRFLIAATRLGGLHGYGPQPASAPLGGAVTGFVKAYAMEQGVRDTGRGVLVKAVDFARHTPSAEPADLLIAETLHDPGATEVGYYDGQRYSITLTEQPARDGQPGMTLDKDTVFVITGAAGGITSAIVADLAANSSGTFYLLDLTALPARDDPHVRLFRGGRDALKAALIEEARGRGEKPTPAVIDRQIATVERGAAALAAVEAVEAAGGTARYHSLDLRDAHAVAAVIDDLRQRYGRIDVLVHAGGLLIDRTLPNKEPEQFDLVFDVKADGLFNLLHAAGDMPLAAVVSFSSVAGRFGNNGQSDYSAANDLLCKLSSNMMTWRPDTRAIAVDWTAWGQIGMASRGAVPQIMEALGIDMLPPEAGVPTVRRELTYGGTRGEVLIAGRLGAWLDERAPNGGADLDTINASVEARGLFMAGRVTATGVHSGLVVETLLDPGGQPFLYDHAPDAGTPWLPGVMATEALAQVASVLPQGYRVGRVEDVEMLAAFKFFRMEPRSLHLAAVTVPGEGGELISRVTLRSVTQPPKEGAPAQVRDHFRGRVILTADAEPLSRHRTIALPHFETLTITADEIYRTFFHGPAYRAIERAAVQGDTAVALMAAGLPPDLAPADAHTLMAPRLVELCFQTAALWSVKTLSAMAFPLGIGAVTVYRQESESEGSRLYCIVRTAGRGATYDAQVVDETGAAYVDLRGYRTVSRPA
jgi:malonyl CoA-acyl carrier protein transacylase